MHNYSQSATRDRRIGIRPKEVQYSIFGDWTPPVADEVFENGPYLPRKTWAERAASYTHVERTQHTDRYDPLLCFLPTGPGMHVCGMGKGARLDGAQAQG